MFFILIWLAALRWGGRAVPGADAAAMSKSKARIYTETSTKTTFDDVAGVDEAKEELKEVGEFLRDPATYGRLGAHVPKPDKPEPNRRFRTRSALGRAGYFWMICRFTSARIFPQRGCKLNEPNGFEPLWRVHDRIIRALSPINFAHKR
jgi:hypothetical protein